MQRRHCGGCAHPASGRYCVRRSDMVHLLLIQVIAAAGLLSAQLPASPVWAEASESTVGTASTVSPSTVAAGGTLCFTLSGFPAGAQVEILLDDVETQVLANVAAGGDGTASGTVELPKLIGMGPHWLRFRSKPAATAPAPTLPSGANESLTANGVQATTAPSPAVSNKSPFFNVGEVTIIGAAPAQRPTAVTSRTETSDDVAQVDDHTARGGSSLLPGSVLATAGVVSALAVGIVVNRRRRLPPGTGSL